MLTFLCDPDERHLPMAQRTKMWVCDGDKRVATLTSHASTPKPMDGIESPDESADRSQQTAMWSAKIHHQQFDPFAHDHDEFDEDNPQIHVARSEEGLLSLVNPNKQSLSDARQWVRDHYTGSKSNV